MNFHHWLEVQDATPTPGQGTGNNGRWVTSDYNSHRDGGYVVAIGERRFKEL